MVIDKYRNAIAEPSRLAVCPPLIRSAGQAAQRVRHVVIDEAGTSRERMPMGVILFSYFILAGGVRSDAVLDILDRQGPSTIGSLCDGPPPRKRGRNS